MAGRKIKVVPVGSAEEEAAAVTTSPPSRKPRSIRPWRLFHFSSCFDKLVVFVGAIFACAMGAIMPAFAIIFGDSVEATAPGVSAVEAMSDTLMWFGVICGGMFAVATVWQACFLWSSERQCARMRKAYLEAVLTKDISWFDINSPAELPTRMAAEVQSIQDALGAKLGQIFVCVAQFLAGLIVAFTRGDEGWKMTLVICGAVPVFAIAGMWLGVVVAAVTGSKQTAYAKAGAVAEEVLWSMRTIVAFGGEEREAKRYYSELWPAKRQANCTGMQMGCAFGMMMGAFAGIYAVAFWFGAHHMTVSGGEIIMVFFSVIIGVMSLGDLGDPLVKWGTALVSGGAMFPTLDEKPRIEACRGNPGDEGVGVIQTVEFSNVTFNYPSRPDVTVLRGASLTIQRGRKHALVGESGSGKSTVVQLLERFYDPDDGEVLVNGRNLKTLPLAWWRKQMGYVGQEPVLFATTVKRNITGGDDSVPDEKVIQVVKQAQAFDFLDALPKKLNTYVGVGGGQMSGGQKQRIAIARALMRSPQILLLDEATSALDNESEKQVQATIDRLQANEASSITTISVAHRLSTIRNADVIFFLKAGAVRERGSHQELMALQGDYFALVKSQESVSSEEPTDGELKVINISTVTSPAAAAAMVQGQVSPAAEAPAQVNPEQKLMRKDSAEGKLKSEKEIEEERLKELKEMNYSMPMMRLLGLSKREWIFFPLAFIGCLASGAVMPVQGYVLANATEVFYLFTGDALKKKVNQWALWFVFCGLSQWIGEFLKWSLFTHIQESLALRLRDMSFRALLRQDVGFFDDPANTPAGLTTTLERQTKQVSQMTGINLGNVTSTFCAITTGLVLGFIGSWRLTAVCLALMPVVMIAISIVMVAQMGSQEGNSAYAHAGAILSEAILNIRTVRALQAEQQSLDSFAEVVDQVAGKEGGCMVLRKAAAYGFGQSASFIIYVVGFWYGAKLIDDGRITQSEMFESIYCVMFGLFGAGMAMAFAPDAAKGKIAAHDIFRLVDRESKVDAVKPTGSHTSLGNGTITFDNVTFHYPHRPELPVLKGLSFTALAGQTVALVGPSGSGKSTVIQMLQRFYDPTTGQVLVGNVDLKTFNIAWWRQQVALVGQEPVLFDMSLEDNVKYGKPGATRAEVEAAARKANMDYVLNGKAKWEDPVGLRGGRLSGGQKQRCAIARAIIREPSVLLLDEATSALDSVSEKEVQKALDAARQGRTTFTIAHRLSTIQDSDKIVVVVQGTLSEQGTHEELMKQGGVYANLAKRGSA